jgi:hypothetical protein
MERVRAWILLKVTEPAAVVAEIVKSRGEFQGRFDLGLLSWGGDDLVVVRADVVECENGWNLVVPVDARTEDHLHAAMAELTRAAGSRLLGHTVLRVMDPHPRTPHQSHSFVTEAEWREFEDPSLKPGVRNYPASPGANPWG